MTETDADSEKLEPVDESAGKVNTPYNPGDIRIDTLPMNLGDLIDMIGEGWVNFDTAYQRVPDLWPADKQSLLIESILLGLRLPAFYFEEVTRRQWNIIDGLQRCCAIRNFFIAKSLRLSKLQFLGAQFEEQGYDDFDFATRRDCRMLPITVHVLDKDTPSPVKYILFSRLNTGGESLKPQEIRTAMFQDVIGIVKDMAESDQFRTVLSAVKRDRQQHLDFVSRFAAFYLLGFELYRPEYDLDTFVNLGMDELRRVKGTGLVDKMRKDFGFALDVVYRIFGTDAFRKRLGRDETRRPVNKAYFEALSVTLAKLSDNTARCLEDRRELFIDNMIVMMNRPAFLQSISSGTGMCDRVQTRFHGVGEAVACTLRDERMK